MSKLLLNDWCKGFDVGFKAGLAASSPRIAEKQSMKTKLPKSRNAKYAHMFTVTVITSDSRKLAELALLCAFAKRRPDGCEFHLSKKKPTLTRCVQRKAK